MTQFGHIVFGGIASASYQPGGAPGVPVPPKPLIPPPPLPLLLPLPPLPLSVVSGDPPPSSLEDPPELLLELEELLELELDPPELDPPVSPPLDEELELVAPEPPELELLVAPAPAGVPVPGAVVLEQAAATPPTNIATNRMFFMATSLCERMRLGARSGARSSFGYRTVGRPNK